MLYIEYVVKKPAFSGQNLRWVSRDNHYYSGLDSLQVSRRHQSDSQFDDSCGFIDEDLFDTLPQGYELFLGQAVSCGWSLRLRQVVCGAGRPW